MKKSGCVIVKKMIMLRKILSKKLRVASQEKHSKQGAEREQDVVGEGKGDAYGKDADQEAVSTCTEC